MYNLHTFRQIRISKTIHIFHVHSRIVHMRTSARTVMATAVTATTAVTISTTPPWAGAPATLTAASETATATTTPATTRTIRPWAGAKATLTASTRSAAPTRKIGTRPTTSSSTAAISVWPWRNAARAHLCTRKRTRRLRPSWPRFLIRRSSKALWPLPPAPTKQAPPESLPPPPQQAPLRQSRRLVVYFGLCLVGGRSKNRMGSKGPTTNFWASFCF